MSDVAGRLAEHDRRLDQHEHDIKDIHRELKKLRQGVHTVRQEMHEGFDDVRREMHEGFDDVRREMREGFDGVRQELDGMHREAGWTREALVRVMTHLEIEPPRDDEEQ
jgi:uncharacterized coiled-coil DUF342 family protein